MINGQAATDALKGLRDEGPAAVRNQVDGEAVALTRRIEHGQGHPTRLGGGHGAGQHGAGIAVEDDQAPPAMPLQGKIHHPAINKPVLVCRRGFERVRLRWGGRGVEGLRAWNIRIDLAIEGHDAFDRAHGQIRCAAQTPDPKAPGIGMALLQMIDLQHHGEPHLARWGMRRGALVREAGRIIVFEARNPPINRGPRDLQELTDTAFTPALRIEGNDFLAGLDALGIAVVVEERPGGRRRWREAVPEAARRLAGEAMHGGMKNDPRQFAGAKPGIEPFEPLEFVHDSVGHPQLAMSWVDVQGLGHEPEHPLLRKAALEAAHGFWMGPGFLRALRRGPLGTKQQRADEFIPILRGVEKRQLGVISIGIAPHW